MPWFEDQLDFLPEADDMERQSRAVDRLADDDETARLFHLARRRSPADPVVLPWLDVDHAILIAISHNAGDDTALALDYRTGLTEPRVVGSDIWTVPNQYHWRVITLRSPPSPQHSDSTIRPASASSRRPPANVVTLAGDLIAADPRTRERTAAEHISMLIRHQKT